MLLPITNFGIIDTRRNKGRAYQIKNNGGDLQMGRLETLFLTENNTATTTFDLDGINAVPGVDYGQITVTGGNAITLGGSLVLNLLPLFTTILNDEFTLVANKTGKAIRGTFAGLPEGAVFYVDGHIFQITYKGNGGDDVVLTDVVTFTGFVAPAFTYWGASNTTAQMKLQLP